MGIPYAPLNLTGQRDQVWMLRFTMSSCHVMCGLSPNLHAKDVALLLDDEVAQLPNCRISRVSLESIFWLESNVMVSLALRCKVPKLRRVFEDVFELVCLIRCDTSSMLAVLPWQCAFDDHYAMSSVAAALREVRWDSWWPNSGKLWNAFEIESSLVLGKNPENSAFW